MMLFALTERLQKRFRKTVSSDCDVTKGNCYQGWHAIYFVTMRLPFNAKCGDVASWRNDQTDWKQVFAKFINFSSLNHLGWHKKNLRGHCPRMPPRGHGPDSEWWVPVSGMKVRSLVGLSTHSAFHWWSAQCVTHMLLSDKLMSCCAAGTNGCLDLRRRAFVLDGRVSAEWNRCPDSMARRARDNVALLRRSSADWMPVRIGRLSAGVERSHLVAIPKVSLMAESVTRVWVWDTRQEGRNLQLNASGVRQLFATLFLQHPSQCQQGTSRARRAMPASCAMTQGVGDTWATCPTVIWARSRRAGFQCCSWLWSHV